MQIPVRCPGSSSRPRRAPSRRRLALALVLAVAAMALILAACEAAGPAGTPAITPGTGAAPREVNIIAREYGFAPTVVDLVPGETVVLHVVNGGLETHEAILGDLPDQLAWESAEGATVGAPPGPTPVVPQPAGFDGVRVVVGSGQRGDVTWTVPSDATAAASGWFVGCHIPGHWQKGMVVPVRFVEAGGRPLGTPPPLPVPSPGG